MDGNGSGGMDRLRGIFEAAGERRPIRRGERLHAAGEASAHVYLIARGWIGRTRATTAGDTAFTGLHIRGDVVGADGAYTERLDDDLHALTDGLVIRMPTGALRDAVARDAEAGAAMMSLLATDSFFLREALFAVGRLSSSERLCVFLLQTYRRQIAAGIIPPGARGFALPLTQPQLAAVTGVTAVHLNRVLQMLRGLGCVDMRGGVVRIQDLDALERETRAGPAGPRTRAAGGEGAGVER